MTPAAGSVPAPATYHVRMTLTEFLLARLAEDEAAALAANLRPGDPDWQAFAVGTGAPRRFTVRSRYCHRVVARTQDIPSVDGWATPPTEDPTGVLDGAAVAAHVARWDPARVLAECTAWRIAVGAGDDAVLRALAAVYSDHPDYRPEWSPGIPA